MSVKFVTIINKFIESELAKIVYLRCFTKRGRAVLTARPLFIKFQLDFFNYPTAC